MLTMSLVASGGVSAADNVSAQLDYHIADAFIQGLGFPPQTGAVAEVSSGTFDGHQVRVSGSGTFNTASMKATGGGALVHTDQSGDVQGFATWTATGVDSATLYPCGGEGLPANACGGVVTLKVRINGTSTTLGALAADGLLTIDCEINPPPPGGVEGIKLSVPAFPINFDQTNFSLGGLTVFVSRSHQ
jgi:hypothetical protein